MIQRLRWLKGGEWQLWWLPLDDALGQASVAQSIALHSLSIEFAHLLHQSAIRKSSLQTSSYFDMVSYSWVSLK